MFCFKCGAEVPNGSKFCEKCGASLADGNVTQTPGGEPVREVQQPVCVPADASKKKKRKKWSFILGGAVLLFLLIIIVAIGGGDEPESQPVQSSADVNLSETYTNDEEGFSFKYPSGWKPIDEERMAELIGSGEDDYSLVLLANEIEDMPEESTYIMVSKFDLGQDAIDHLFIEDEQFAETFDKEASIKDTSVTELDGVPARKITYIDSDGLGYESYFYAVDSVLYRIDFVWKGESAGSSQPFFDAVIGSYKITSDKKNEIVKTGSYDDAPDSIEENEESTVQDRTDIGETQGNEVETDEKANSGTAVSREAIPGSYSRSSGPKCGLSIWSADEKGILFAVAIGSSGYLAYVDMRDCTAEWTGENTAVYTEEYGDRHYSLTFTLQDGGVLVLSENEPYSEDFPLAGNYITDEIAEDSCEFVFPEDNVFSIDVAELEGKTAAEYKIARNEIYARHGRRFNDEQLQGYFDTCSWYEGTIEPENFSDAVLNEVEKSNLQMISEYEARMGY